MVQKKHKKRKQHTKTKATVDPEQELSAETEEPAKKKGLFSKKDDEASGSDAKKGRAKEEPKGKDGKAAKPGLFRRFVNYCKAVKAEMQRVVWPTRQELLNASLIVIGAIVFFGVYIAIIDTIVVIPLDWIASLGV